MFITPNLQMGKMRINEVWEILTSMLGHLRTCVVKIPPVVNMLCRGSYTLLCVPEMIAAATHKSFEASSSSWRGCHSPNMSYCLCGILLKTPKFMCTSKCGPFTYIPEHHLYMYICRSTCHTYMYTYMHKHTYTHTNHTNAITHIRGTHTHSENVCICNQKERAGEWL